MSVLKQRLIESAVRPLDDNAEMRMAASRLLDELVTEDAPGAEIAVARWVVVDTRPRKPLWRILLWGLLLSVSGLVGFHAVRVIASYQNQIGDLPTDLFYSDPAVNDESVAANLTEEQRLLVFGDLSRSEEWERMQALWESEPENPAYYARYAETYISETGSLPPDFLKIAGEIDPDNAWFTYIAAGVTAKDAVRKRKRSKAAQLAQEAFEWDILDQARFDQSITILRQARQQPRCESNWSDLLNQQLSFIPHRTPPEFLYSTAYALKTPLGSFSMRNLADVISTEVWLTGENGDTEGFREIIADADHFLEMITDAKVESLIGELINTSGAAGIISNLSAAADKLKLDPETARLVIFQQRFVELIALKKSRKRMPNSELVYDKAGLLASHLTSFNMMVENPPLLTEADLKPGRLVDHEVLSWICFHLGWLVLLVCCGLAFCFRFWTPPMIRRLAARFEKLMRPSDELWVLGVGIVVPLLMFLAVTRLTPLGGRDLSVERTIVSWKPLDPLPLSFVQFAGLVVTMILLSVSICRWRIGRRTAFFGISRMWDWLLWLAIACAVLFVPCIGWAEIHSSEGAGYAAKRLLAASLIFLVITCGFTFFSNTKTVLRSALVARMLVPAFAFAALLFISAAPFFKRSANRWFERDQLLKPSRDDPHWTDFERNNALQLRKELRARLGYQP